MGWYLALDISGSRCRLRRVTAGGAVGDGLDVANGGRDAAAYWAEIAGAATALAAGDAPQAAGIAFGGPVGRDGRILSIHVGGWSTLDPAAELAARLGCPVRVDNDANCGALGEHRYGRHAGACCLIFMTCSTGIGGGIIADGAMLRGARGQAGELGHMSLMPDGRPCPCGSCGCLEAHCSGTAIAARATEALASGAPSRLREALIDGRVAGAKPVFDAAAAGDALARSVLAAVHADFGRALAAIHNAFDPDVILVGGGVSLAGEALWEPVRAAARPFVMAHRRDDFRVESASLGEDAQLLGAAALVMPAR